MVSKSSAHAVGSGTREQDPPDPWWRSLTSPKFVVGTGLTLWIASVTAAFCLGGIRTGGGAVLPPNNSHPNDQFVAETLIAAKTTDHRLSNLETSAANPTSAGSQKTSTPEQNYVGVAGVIDDSFADRPVFCPGGRRYDPEIPALAVTVGLASTGRLPCGAHVRVSRSLDDGSVLTLEMDVVDQFPDSAIDVTAPTARSFNLSRQAAQILNVTGVATIEVVLLSPPLK